MDRKPFLSALPLATLLALTSVVAHAQDAPIDENLKNNILRAQVNTLYGPTGLITIPHAYATPQSRVVLGMNLGKDNSGTLNYGLLRSLEVGGGYLQRSGANDKFLANGKFNIVASNLKGLEIGVGFIDAFDAVNATFFAVASMEFVTPKVLENKATGLRLHLGFGSGLFHETVMAGAEILFGRKVSAIAEYNGRFFNFGLRYVHDDNFRMQAGMQNDGFFFNTTYAFNF